LAGDFNNWNVKACPMKRLKNGSFSVTVPLKAGHSYLSQAAYEKKYYEKLCAA
jgi:1,4-alpha-glucan branching enzyme